QGPGIHGTNHLQAEGLTYHTLGQRPGIPGTNHSQAEGLTYHTLGQGPGIHGTNHLQAEGLTYHTLGQRPKHPPNIAPGPAHPADRSSQATIAGREDFNKCKILKLSL
ncbi:hypothetical protein ACW6QP_10375, partial [Salegentibacter sp. HM20]